MSSGKRKRSVGSPGQSLADALDFTDPPSVTTRYHGYIRRPDLVKRLREAKDYPLVLLTAPAGYAKTSVLAEWADQDERPFAWMTLDSRDDEATQLLNRLVEAVDGVSLKGRPFVLVVDNAHVLRTRGALDALANTIASLRPDGHVAMASRRELRLPLGRMRARHEIFELTRRDLAMSRSDSAALLHAIGLDLRPEEVETLFAQTEGWPAALYLAGLFMGQGPDVDVDVDVARFGGDDRFVSDFLKDEFMAGMSVARIRFLLRSSVLETLTGQNCDEVLERSGSARVLRELARANLPLEPLDHSDGSYRYHPLFRQMLRSELHRREPDVEGRLNRRASTWYADREQFQEAIDHAIAAGDQTRAAELIWARAGHSVAMGDREAVRAWLDRFGDRKIAGSPQLALCAAHLYLALGEGELGLHWASVAHEGFDEAASDDPDLLADLLMLRATLPQDGIAQMGRDATSAAELHPPDSPWRGISCFYSGAARQLSGDSLKARELLEEGARRGAANAPLVQVFCLTQLTLLHLDRHDLESALRVIAQAREQLNRFHLDVYPVMAFAFAASALTRSREGRIEEAVADCKRAMELLEHLGGFPDWYLAETYIMLARASMNLDDAARTRSLLDNAAMFAARVHDGPTLGRWISESLASASSISSSDDRAELTPAELRTLQFLPTHLSFREIAERSFVSPNTVKTQAQAIYRKLDASSRAEAVDQAREAGLLPDEPSTHMGQWPQP
jgi:LuxR family transcriptional regulator, maltose regulon positive regulatory protein